MSDKLQVLKYEIAANFSSVLALQPRQIFTLPTGLVEASKAEAGKMC
jgi:hypothetical protein